jgi:5-methylcytosine-specific restriction endonuclease McrA
MEVDKIVPRNQIGSNDLSNLQAVCFRCNAGNRDIDNTDFCGCWLNKTISWEDLGVSSFRG